METDGPNRAGVNAYPKTEDSLFAFCLRFRMFLLPACSIGKSFNKA